MVGGHHLFGGSNGTCPLPKNEADLLLKGIPIAGSLTFQRIMFIVSIAAAGLTTAISLFLIFKHLHRYTIPREQRQIIRMIFTPVVFSVLSALSILDYSAAIYLKPLTDLYEAFGLCALFLLFIEYVAPDRDGREAFFNSLENRKQQGSIIKPSKEYNVVPGGSLRWYKMKWVIVFAYLFAEIIMTIVQEASQGAGTYCATSFKPRFAHFWVVIIENVALVMAALALINYYFRMKSAPNFSRHKPGLKFLSFKLIIWVNFIQNLLFNILIGTRSIHGSTRVTGLDIAYGIPAMLIALEQIFFAIFFHYSFRSREYHESENINMKEPRMGVFRAAAHAFNPWDLIRGMGTAVKMLMSGVRQNDEQNMPEGAMQPQWHNQGRQQWSAYDNRNTHLEPMSNGNTHLSQHGQVPYNNRNSYDRQYAQRQSMSPPSRAYHAPPPQYANVEDETSHLNPSYVQTHSREPSIDRDTAKPKSVV